LGKKLWKFRKRILKNLYMVQIRQSQGVNFFSSHTWLVVDSWQFLASFVVGKAWGCELGWNKGHCKVEQSIGPIPVKPVALGFTVCREVGKFLTTYLCDLS
jgi:hypothetical protein